MTTNWSNVSIINQKSCSHSAAIDDKIIIFMDQFIEISKSLLDETDFGLIFKPRSHNRYSNGWFVDIRCKRVTNPKNKQL